jgi:hypothetical protein
VQPRAGYRALVQTAHGQIQQLAPRRPLWQEIGLSAAFTGALVAFGAAATYAGNVFLKTDNGVRAFTIFVFLIVVPFLVAYAYPPRRRRWYHWAGFEACVLLVAPIWIPLIYLPWLIVTRKAWRGG